MTSAANRVLIVGGGITGSVLAIALANAGVEVVLAEARREWSGIGHGITIQGNALKAFRTVGVLDELMHVGVPFDKLRLKTAMGGVIAEIPTPHTGGNDLPSTLGALRSDLAEILARRVRQAGVDVRLGTTATELADSGSSVRATFTGGAVESFDLVVAADGIRSRFRAELGFAQVPKSIGMGIWRVIAKRPVEMDCAEIYYGGPKFKAGYSPISEELCYAYLLESNLDQSFIGEHPNGSVMKEHGKGYEGIWGDVRDSVADDAIVNYQWLESVFIDDTWHRGRIVVIGDAAHACPPLIAQGAAMCAEDAVVLAEVLNTVDDVDEALNVFEARRIPRAKMVVDASLQLAEWEMHPETPGADPAGIMSQTLDALRAPA